VTTIACLWDKSGRKLRLSIASDTFAHTDLVGYSVSKIQRCGDTLIGCSGSSDDCQAFMNWRNGGRPPKLAKSLFEGLVVDKTGVYVFAHSLVPERIRNFSKHRAFHAIGSGRQYALGAMATVADVQAAVVVSAKFDPFSKAPVEILWV
jgi:hypothetical protein